MNRSDYELHTPFQIGPLSIPNRFMRSGTADISLGRLGGFTEDDVSLCRALAEGGVGLIIVNGPPVLPDSIYAQETLASWEYRYADSRVENTASVLAAIREASPDCRVIA